MNTELLFTLDDIRDLSDAKVFVKGENYFESGAVGKIIRRGDIFEGKVAGTQKYNVRLEIKGDLPEIRCSCPYEFGGICKHAVAFAIAVLNGEYQESKGIQEAIDEYTTEEFVSSFSHTENAIKVEFLRQLLLKDPLLQSQFMKFKENTPGKQVINTGVDIEEIKNDVYRQLSSMEFDHFVEEYDPYDDGFYDEEGYIDEANESLGYLYEEYIKNSIGLVQKGNIVEAAMIVCGLIEGSQNLPDPQDNYNIFDGDFNYYVNEKLRESLAGFASEVRKAILSDENIFSAIRVMFQRYRVNKSQPNDAVFNYLKELEELLIALIKNEKIAVFLSDQIDTADVDRASIVYVKLKIAEVSENEELWIKIAEEFASSDGNICMQLLEKYKSESGKMNFRRVAKAAFDAWPYDFDQYIIDHLDKNGDDSLYVMALKHYTRRQQSIKHYKELKNYMDDKEKDEFINQVKGSHHEVFYVKMLEAESRFSEILVYVRDRLLITWSFSEIIIPIINVYPDDCFEMFVKKCNQALNAPKRNRDTYLQMVSWLKLMKKIVSKQNETQKFIESLYHHKPNLPALKDEMKKAGLM